MADGVDEFGFTFRIRGKNSPLVHDCIVWASRMDTFVSLLYSEFVADDARACAHMRACDCVIMASHRMCDACMRAWMQR